MTRVQCSVGMNNPLSDEPRHALFPRPVGYTGYRVLQLLRRRAPDATERDYLRVFDRRNLVTGREWSATRARDGALALVAELRDSGRSVLVLGEGPRKALDLPKRLLHPVDRDGVTWRMTPHPSGRCHFYNDEFARDVVSFLLEELYEMGRSWLSDETSSERRTVAR